MAIDPRMTKSWYLIYCKPRQEGVAQDNLERQGFVVYLPRVRQHRRRQNKRIVVIEPLFPRYLFIHLDLHTDNWAPIRSTTGVSAVVRFGQEPVAVPPGLVAMLMGRDDESGIHTLHNTEYIPGMPLRIVEGPMFGYEGIFLSKTSNDRVIVLLDIMEKQVRVKLDRGQVEGGTGVSR